MPQLGCIEFFTFGGDLEILATDLNQWQRVSVPCDDTDPISKPSLVNFNHLYSSLGDAEFTTIVDNSGFILVTCGNRERKINTLPASDLMNPPSNQGMRALGISCEDLAEGLESVAFAAAKNIGRAELESVCISCQPKMMRCIASDGRLGAMFRRPLMCAEAEFLVPDDRAKKLAANLRLDGAVLSTNERIVMVQHNAGMYACKKLENQFPIKGADYQFSQPKTGLGEVNVKELSKEVESIQMTADENNYRLNIKSSPEGLKLNLVGAASEANGTISGAFQMFDIVVDVNHLAKCVKSIKSDRCKLFIGESGFIAFQSGDLDVILMALRK